MFRADQSSSYSLLLDLSISSGGAAVPCNINSLSLLPPESWSPIKLGYFNGNPGASAGIHVAEQVAGYGESRGLAALQAIKATFVSCGYTATPGLQANVIKFTGYFVSEPTEWEVVNESGVLIEVAIADQTGQDFLLDKLANAIEMNVNRILARRN